MYSVSVSTGLHGGHVVEAVLVRLYVDYNHASGGFREMLRQQGVLRFLAYMREGLPFEELLRLG